MVMSFAGGILIGLSALFLYAALGRIAGISGIVFGALDADGRRWRLPFLAGLAGGSWIAVLAGLPRPPTTPLDGFSSVALLVVAGLLVGSGTRLGNGCTSGHGVCGLARLSKRSLAAVVVFMGIGMITATFLRAAVS